MTEKLTSVDGATPVPLPLPELADIPLPTEAYRDWAVEQYEQARTPLARLEALAQMPLAMAWEQVVQNSSTVTHDYLVKRTAEAACTDADSTWRTLMRASILETSLNTVCNHTRIKVSEENEPYLPDFNAVPAEQEFLLDPGAVTPRPIPEAYYALQTAYDLAARQPRTDEDKRPSEYDTAKHASEILLNALDWRPQPGEYQDALDWTQLGRQVKGGMLAMRRRDNIPIKPGRFIGQSDDSDTFETYRMVKEKIIDERNEDLRLERSRDLIEVCIGMVKENEPDAACKQEYITRCQRIMKEPSATTAWMDAYFNSLRQDFFKEASRGHKAVYLAKWLKYYRFDDPEQKLLPSRLPWLADVPDELIDRTFEKYAEAETAGHAESVDAHSFMANVLGVDVSLNESEVEGINTLTQKGQACLIELNAVAQKQGYALRPDQLLQLANAVLFSAQELNNLIGQGYAPQDILAAPWLPEFAPHNMAKPNFQPKSPRTIRQRWLCDQAPNYLEDGWNRATIGKIIVARLSKEDVDPNAVTGYFEAFQIPEVYNGRRLKGAFVESSYLATMLCLPDDQRQRGQFTAKEAQIRQVFSLPEHRSIYQAMLQLMAEPGAGFKRLQELVYSQRTAYFDNLASDDNPLTGFRMSRKDFYASLDKALEGVQVNAILARDMDQDISLASLHYQLLQLKDWGQQRQQYVHEATAWLLKHVTNPQWKLKHAWQKRSAALAAGVPDTVESIIRWWQINQMEVVFGDTSPQPNRPSNAEIASKYANWVAELAGDLTADEILDAIINCALPEKQPKMFPAITAELSEGKERFHGTILASDDPRGLTMGRDTGCCFRWNRPEADIRGAIKAGYVLPFAGFFTLENSDRRMMAQSLFYVDPRQPDILVLDSIEANAGRNPAKALRLYQQFWENYLRKRSREDPDWKVTTVQVGTGHTRVDYSHLQLATTTPIAEDMPYSDAKEQRILLDMTPAELRWPSQLEWHRPQQDTAPSQRLISIRDRHAAIVNIERQAFPTEYQEFTSIDTVQEFLTTHPGATHFSVMNMGSADQNGLRQPDGYCLAFAVKDQDDDAAEQVTLHIPSLAVLPSAAPTTGVLMFKEVLMRAQDHNATRVLFDTREATSHRFFTSESFLRRLAEWGFEVANIMPIPSSEDDLRYEIELHLRSN